MPDDDPTDGVVVPPPCSRWPTCEGYDRGWMDPLAERDPDTCTWPACGRTSAETRPDRY